MCKKKVSVDFDHTLSNKEVQRLVIYLLGNNVDVWVTTTRYENVKNYKAININHNDLITVLKEVNIPFHKVNFTNFEWKYKFFENHNDFIWHLDDNPDEYKFIIENTKINVEPIIYGRKKWRKTCLKLLELK